MSARGTLSNTDSLDQLLKQYSAHSESHCARTLRQDLRAHWTGYAAATGAALAMAPTADAAVQHIVPMNPVRIELANNLASGTSQYTSVDFNNDGAFDMFFTVAASTSGPSNLYQFGLAQSIFGTMSNGARIFTAGGTTGAARKFASGEMISSGLPNSSLAGFRSVGLYSSAAFQYGQWSANDNAIAGVQFRIGGQDHLGWVRVALESNANGLFALELHEWAYEDVANQAIVAGDTGIPEPGTFGLAALALGAAGVATLRRRHGGI